MPEVDTSPRVLQLKLCQTKPEITEICSLLDRDPNPSTMYEGLDQFSAKSSANEAQRHPDTRRNNHLLQLLMKRRGELHGAQTKQLKQQKDKSLEYLISF